MNWAWRQRVGNPTRKAILVALADHADSDGVCWPGHEGIGDRVEVSRRTVIRQIERLEADGLLTIERRRGADGTQSTNLYRLRVTDCHSDGDRVTQVAHGEAENRVTPTSPGPGDTGDANRVTFPTPPGDTGDANRVTPMSHEPSREPPEEPPREPGRARVDGREATDSETETSRAIIAAFANLAQQRFTTEAWAERVIRCLRAHPDVTEADHMAIIAAAFQDPWWQGQPTPAVLYGNVGQFERQLAEWRGGNATPASSRFDAGTIEVAA